MVEGSGTNELSKPTAPLKKFYKKDAPIAEILTEECKIIPSIPPRPLMAPKLPMRPSTNHYNNNNNNNNKEVISANFYPLEDNIYTGLKPEFTVNKFYYHSNTTTQQNGQSIAASIPNDFIAKAFIDNDKLLIGLQHGKITVLCVDKLVISSADGINRQFYELISLNLKKKSFLAFQDTGNIFKARLENGNLQIALLLRSSVPMGTMKILVRPEVGEVWAVGIRETSILLMNTRDEDVALVKRVPSHFPEATSISFLGAEDLAVIQRDRSVQMFTISRFSHQPALIANLPPVIGEIVKIIKLSMSSYGTIYSDGKMIIWRFEKDELKEKITGSLTLFRVQTVQVISDLIWLGLGNGKLLIVKVDSNSNKQIILGEVKYHQTAITKFIKGDEGRIVTLDSSGQLCTWDECLKFYKQNQLIWEREADYCRYERVSLRICSWNAAAQNPFDCCDAIGSRWLGLDGACQEDLLVISLQEIVDLNARSFGANQSFAALDQWIKFIQKRLARGYNLVHSSTMVGLGLIVFCREGVKGALSSVSDDSVKTGLGGLHGNKGGLVWRTFIYDCPVAFVACHLAAGQAAISERNNDAATILRTAALTEATTSRKDPFAFATGNGGTRLFDHSAIFIAGDLNYRIEMDRSDCLNRISEGNWSILNEKDQLNSQMNRKELLLSYFHEGQLKFPPTYKYDRGTIDRFDSSEKARVPAWCDRILFYSKKSDIIQSSRYESIPEATLSDHKPIYRVFELKCRIIDEKIRSNLFY